MLSFSIFLFSVMDGTMWLEGGHYPLLGVNVGVLVPSQALLLRIIVIWSLGPGSGHWFKSFCVTNRLTSFLRDRMEHNF